MPLFTTKATDHLFERFMKHQPNYKTDSPEADRIQETLDAEKERKEARPMIYRDDRHHHTFEKEAAMRPESISRALLAALYLLTADRNLWNQVRDHISPVSYTHLDVYKRQGQAYPRRGGPVPGH